MQPDFELGFSEYCCVTSIDVGSYNSCKHNCSYCYATWNYGVSNEVDSLSPILGSSLCDGDKINDRKVPVLKEQTPELF